MASVSSSWPVSNVSNICGIVFAATMRKLLRQSCLAKSDLEILFQENKEVPKKKLKILSNLINLKNLIIRPEV